MLFRSLQTIQLLPLFPTILTKLGADGVLLTELLKPNDPRLTNPADAPYILSRCTNGSTEVGGVYMSMYIFYCVYTLCPSPLCSVLFSSSLSLVLIFSCHCIFFLFYTTSLHSPLFSLILSFPLFIFIF